MEVIEEGLSTKIRVKHVLAYKISERNNARLFIGKVIEDKKMGLVVIRGVRRYKISDLFEVKILNPEIYRHVKNDKRKRKSGMTYNSRINDRYIRVEIIEYSDKESTQSGKREIINRCVINVTNREYEDVISLVESMNISEDFTVRKSQINLNY